MRLAFCGDNADYEQLQRGLRGTSVTLCSVPQLMASPADAAGKAIAVLEPCLADCLLELVSRGQPLLLAAGAWLDRPTFESIASAAAGAGTPVAVVNPDQHLPSRRHLRQQLSAGKLGSPGLIRLHRWQPAANASALAAGATSSAGARRLLPSVLLGDLELILSWMGGVPNVTFATAAEANPGLPGDGVGTILVHLGFEGGGMALLDYSDQLPAGDHYLSVSVIGSAGAAYADDHDNRQLRFVGGPAQAVRVPENARQVTSLVQEFLDQLVRGHDFQASLDHWRTVLRLAEAIGDSLATGQAIAWDAGASMPTRSAAGGPRTTS